MMSNFTQAEMEGAPTLGRNPARPELHKIERKDRPVNVAERRGDSVVAKACAGREETARRLAGAGSELIQIA